MSVKTVVLAYSGGLDTSVIIPWLKETYGAEVIAYCADVGQGDDLEAVRRKAVATGAVKCVVEDLREEFIRDYAFKALSAGAVYEDNYLLGTALARPLIAYRQVRCALREGADALAHGATGKGNDQVRFEVTYGAFAPHLKVIAPWREWKIRSREDALRYAEAHRIPVDHSPEEIFSRDGNLWHLSHEGGNLEDPWDAPRKDMFKLTVDPQDAPDRPEVVTLAFDCGTPVALNGERLGPVAMVERLNQIAGAHGVGRLDLLENRLVGIKSRGVYETPAGTVLHLAHRELERMVLDRDTLHFKQSVSVRYAQLIYDGLWFAALREALAAFVDQTEKDISGEVRVQLFKGHAVALSRRSPNSLYRRDLATFGEGMAFNHADAGGFIRLYGLPERVRALTRDRIPVDVKAVELSERVARAQAGGINPGAITAPLGFRAVGVPCGLKPHGPDLAMVVADWGCTAAGVFTTHPEAAPQVQVSRQHLNSGRARAVVAISGCANPVPDQQGLADAKETTTLTARAIGCQPEEVVVVFTGEAIGSWPMDRIRTGIARAFVGLSRAGGANAALAILAAGAEPNEVEVEFAVRNATARVGAMASGGFAPKITPLLAVFTTDAAVDSALLRRALLEAVGPGLEHMLVDREHNASDTAVVLASGSLPARAIMEEGPDFDAFRRALGETARRLAELLRREVKPPLASAAAETAR